MRRQLDAQFAHLGVLVRKLLHAIFAEDRYPGLVCLADISR